MPDSQINTAIGVGFGVSVLAAWEGQRIISKVDPAKVIRTIPPPSKARPTLKRISAEYRST